MTDAWFGKSSAVHDAGLISQKNAAAVHRCTGVDISGYYREIGGDELRHAYRSHGDDQKEKKRGQRGLLESDFDKLQQIIDEPDEVSHHVGAHRGGNTLEYQKVFGSERFVYVESYSTKRRAVRFISLRVHVKKQGA